MFFERPKRLLYFPQRDRFLVVLTVGRLDDCSAEVASADAKMRIAVF